MSSGQTGNLPETLSQDEKEKEKRAGDAASGKVLSQQVRSLGSIPRTKKEEARMTNQIVTDVGLEASSVGEAAEMPLMAKRHMPEVSHSQPKVSPNPYLTLLILSEF